MKVMMGCSLTALLLAGALLAILLWGGAVFAGMSRDQVALEQAWSRMENAYLHRLELVPDVVAVARLDGRVDRNLLDRLTESVAETSEFVLSPELLNQPDRCGAFRSVQDRMTDDLQTLMDDYGPMLSQRWPQRFARLQQQIEATQAKLAEAREDFNAAAERYNGSLERFPQKGLALLFDFRAKMLWHPQTVDAGNE